MKPVALVVIADVLMMSMNPFCGYQSMTTLSSRLMPTSCAGTLGASLSGRH